MEFSGHVVLVVGASTGIGRGVALRLAAAGAEVAAVARSADRLDELAVASGGRCRAFLADVSDTEDAERLVDDVVAAYGRIDAVLLNVGGAPDLDLRAQTATDVLAVMRSNYDVTVNVLFPVLAQMRAQGGGLVAHTNSLAGWAGIPLQGPYSAAKGAVRLLIDTCRIELGGDGIRFVSAYPGFVATERTAADDMPAPREISVDAAADHVVRALRRETWDAQFPRSTTWLVRLLRAMPKRWSTAYLRRELRRARPAGVP